MLVGPAPIVGHGWTTKRIVHGRVVDEKEEDSSADVDVAEVVPLVLGRDRTIADEDELSVNRHLVDHVPRLRHVVGARLQRARRPGLGYDERVTRLRRQADKRHWLHPAPVGVSGL